MRAILFLLLTAAMLHAQNPPGVRWTRFYNDGDPNDRELVWGMCPGIADGVAMVGSLEVGADDYPFIVETNGEGDTVATRVYATGNVRGIVPIDDGYIACGSQTGQLWVFRLDVGLDTTWSRGFIMSDYNLRAMADDGLGGVVVVGGCQCDTTWGALFLLKVNAAGDSVGTNYIYGSNGASQAAADIIALGNGFVLAGDAFNTEADGAWLARLDTVGNILWQQIYSIPATDTTWHNPVAYAVAACSDGGFILVGDNYGWDYQYDAYVVRTDSVGDTLWTRLIGDSLAQRLLDVIVTDDGGFACAGSIGVPLPLGGERQHMWLLKLDSLGNTVWSADYGDSIWESSAVGAIQADDGGYLVGGTGRNPAQPYSVDFMLVRTEPEGQTADEHHDAMPSLFSLSSYPNPFNSSTTLTFSLPIASHLELALFDLLGRKVKTVINETKSAGEYQVTVDAAELPSGIYVARMQAGETVRSHKLLLLR